MDNTIILLYKYITHKTYEKLQKLLFLTTKSKLNSTETFETGNSNEVIQKAFYSLKSLVLRYNKVVM